MKSGESGGRDIWEHFVCPTDVVHGEVDEAADIEVLVNDQNQIVISSNKEISEIVYVVDGVMTKLTDVDSTDYTLDVLGVTDIWIKSGDYSSGRDFWQHFVCPTDH